jgi:hypothetical protein
VTAVPAGRRAAALLAGLAGALAVRVGVAGGAGVRSVAAGAVFAVLLFGVVVLADARLLRRPGPWRRQAGIGALGAAVLCVVPLVVHLRSGAPPLPAAGFAGWAVVVSAVAVGEEVLLRGALWEALEGWRGEWVALAVSTVAFGLLHVPLYGGSVLVLDLVVGLLLGGVRMVSAGWGGPAVAHTVADLAGWWLR